MVRRTAFLMFVFIAIIALGGMFFMIQDSVTGQYVGGGGGRYYYGPQVISLQPDEACQYQGLNPVRPLTVITNKYGVTMALCYSNGAQIGVPLVQTVVVK